MIVHNLNVLGVATVPTEADSPLIVDAYTHLADPVAFESLQSIPRRVPQVIQCRRGIKLTQLTQRPVLNLARKPPARD